MEPADRRTRVIVLASRYPNDVAPTHGLAAEERTRKLAASGRAIATVIAPVPWFPFRSERFGSWSGYARVPVRERRFGFMVEHPSYLSLPAATKSHTAITLARALLPLLQQRLRKADFDLIDAQQLYPDGVAAVTVGEQLRKPVIITTQGRDFELMAARRSMRPQMVQAALKADAVVAGSQAAHDKLLALGVSPQKLSTIRNGVDLVRFRLQGHNTTKVKLRLAGTIWLAVGRLTPANAVHVIIQTLAHVPGVMLLIVGEGPEESRLRKLTGKLAVESRVHFLGAVAHNQLTRYYNAANALLYAASGDDVPNTVLESIACGTPVVAAPGGGIGEVLSAPDAGEIATSDRAVDMAAAWARLTARAPDRNATRASAEACGWEASIKALCGLYARVAARPPLAPPVAPAPPRRRQQGATP